MRFIATADWQLGMPANYLDEQARPQDDLFGHVNGRWLTDYDIPADRAGTQRWQRGQ